MYQIWIFVKVGSHAAFASVSTLTFALLEVTQM